MNRRACLHLIVIGAMSGCGYTTRPTYSEHIQTVHVPIFQSKAFRRGLEMQLTEAVIKEIERTTPYKVVDSCDADTVLEGTIRYADKRILIETPEDEPRQGELALAVDVAWRDSRTGQVLAAIDGVPVPATLLVRQAGTYAPELGQSIATGHKELVDELARQIVRKMEEAW